MFWVPYCLSSNKQLLIVLSVLHQTASRCIVCPPPNMFSLYCLSFMKQLLIVLSVLHQTASHCIVWPPPNSFSLYCVSSTKQLLIVLSVPHQTASHCIFCPPPNSFSLYCLSSTKQLLIVLSVLHQTASHYYTFVFRIFYWTKTAILTVMADISYDHQQNKLCHIYIYLPIYVACFTTNDKINIRQLSSPLI